MKLNIVLASVFSVIALSIAGCTPTGGSGAQPNGTPTPSPVAVPTQAVAAVSAATADLSQRTNVPADQIAIISVESVDWPDSSLGCPQPGMMYAQVITPGYRITLSAQSTTYVYHTDRASRVVLCQP